MVNGILGSASVLCNMGLYEVSVSKVTITTCQQGSFEKDPTYVRRQLSRGSLLESELSDAGDKGIDGWGTDGITRKIPQATFLTSE